jgi:hypothetical protein
VTALDPTFEQLIDAIVANDEPLIATTLHANPALATLHARFGATRANAAELYYTAIEHYLYAGDTALHIAAAAYRATIVRQLIDLGADVGACNRRGAQPLHYAADGSPGSHTWNPSAQGATVKTLIDAGADPNALDKSGVSPLHRAVRTRATGAVAALLEGGADPRQPNKSGSTPLRLAELMTGRGGSGSSEAKAEQEKIVRLLRQYGTGS